MQTQKRTRANSQKKAGGPSRSGRNSNSSRPKMGYAPVAMSRAVGTGRIPRINSNGGVTHIDHTEYFYSVASTAADYAVVSYPLNPGVAAIFPWLSTIAQRYEKYRFRQLSFDYHTRAATSQVGTVGMVFDFDALDPAPSSQMQALTYQDKVADSPWKDMCLRVDLAQGDRMPVRYTRAGQPSGSYDIKTYDLGNLHIFVDGVAASTNLGLLEVNYSVDLFTPQVQDPVGGLLYNDAGANATHVLGTATTANADAQALLPGSMTGTGVFTFNQAFEGILTFDIVGTVLTANLALVPAGIGAAATSMWQLANAAGTAVVGGAKITAQPGSTITPTITATTVTETSFVFSKCGYNQA